MLYPLKLEKSLLLQALDLKIYELSRKEKEQEELLNWYNQSTEKYNDLIDKLNPFTKVFYILGVYGFRIPDRLLAKVMDDQFSNHHKLMAKWEESLNKFETLGNEVYKYRAYAAVVKFSSEKEIEIDSCMFRELQLALSVIYRTTNELDVEEFTTFKNRL